MGHLCAKSRGGHKSNFKLVRKARRVLHRSLQRHPSSKSKHGQIPWRAWPATSCHHGFSLGVFGAMVNDTLALWLMSNGTMEPNANALHEKQKATMADALALSSTASLSPADGVIDDTPPVARVHYTARPRSHDRFAAAIAWSSQVRPLLPPSGDGPSQHRRRLCCPGEPFGALMTRPAVRYAQRPCWEQWGPATRANPCFPVVMETKGPFGA